MVASHMKKDYITWNKETVEDQKIFDDICEMSGGAIQLSEENMRIGINAPQQQSQRQYAQQRKRQQGNNNQKRKY